MVVATNLGYPRIGPRRELKFALESFWSGKIDDAELLGRAAALRAANWLEQKQAGLGFVPVNDFSLYDHVLDTAVMFGAIPERYGPPTWPLSLRTYFAMARWRPDGRWA